jgi:Viral BACON domain/S-layer homology domain
MNSFYAGARPFANPIFSIRWSGAKAGSGTVCPLGRGQPVPYAVRATNLFPSNSAHVSTGMRGITSLACFSLALAFSASAQSAVTITGALSNFDVYNRTGQPVNGFDITLAGITPAEILQTWTNFHYGAPSVAADNAGNTVVRYRSATIKTAANGLEHFGVVLRNFEQPLSKTFTWTLNGVAVSTPPVPQQTSTLVAGIVSQNLVNSSNRTVWVQRRSRRVGGHSTRLDELMPDNPLVTGATKLEDNPRRLRAGESLRHDDDVEPEMETEIESSSVLAYDIYDDDNGHAGVLIGTMMSATNTGNPEPCEVEVESSGRDFPAAGGPGVINVTASAGCAWTAVSSVAWVVVAPASASGSGNAMVNFTVAANTDPAARAGSIRVAGRTIQITERGASLVQPFDDVPYSHPFYNEISIVKSHGITNGCSPTSYCPDDNTTRGQMAVFIVRAIAGGDNFSYSPAPYFTDVPVNHPFFRWVQKMRDLGLTSGCSPTAYCPDAQVTRGQMSVFLMRALYGNTFSYVQTPYFSDVPANHPFYAFVQKMREMGITSGCSPTQYCPDASTTRGQMAVFLVRAFFAH